MRVKSKKRRYALEDKDSDRIKIHKSLILEIKKIQRNLQLKENMKYGSKAQKVTLKFASRELARRVK